ncbi:DUF6328 family protein [Paraliomyxa miuraensis]|uniref:DUF6328 family protein n=1 Tax=Paraliomyxa miuraensis TaxID=376150 RepID=UPI00225BD4D0|nr:DUF6328 family protein [Paraliomyxa miuraensis]MCX4244177.1 DUF6328 family protein [Paraliomyxa miuraensis]
MSIPEVTEELEGASNDARERYRELLEELRTIIPGVQVLFAFLLTAPFATRFDALDALGVRVFAVALASAGLATVVLLTPAAYHRLAPRSDRHQRIVLGVRVTIAGMALLAVCIASSIFVVGRLLSMTAGEAPPVLSPTTLGLVIASLVAGTAVALWFVLPLVRRNRRSHARQEEEREAAEEE